MQIESSQYVFGPVNSRRLGRSLGIDIIPHKVCTLNCIYCELGRTTQLTLARKPYIRAADVLHELDTVLSSMQPPDHLTFSGSGEPTLNSDIGEMIRGAHLISSLPVAVITNGTTLIDPEVRRDLRSAQVVLPSLDAATECTFHRIDRPHGHVRFNDVLQGIKTFRDEFPGLLWLEILFVKGLNDTPEEITALRDAIERIRPDRVQLNTVVRPPAEEHVGGLTTMELYDIRGRLGESCEVPMEVSSQSGMDQEMREAILACVIKTPKTIPEIALQLHRHRDELVHYITELLRSGQLVEHWWQGNHLLLSARKKK